MVFYRSLLLVLLCVLLGVGSRAFAERPRLAVLTDIGGDPDDTQSLIRLMVYSNEFDIEAIVASAAGTPGELKESVTRVDLIKQVVDAYEKVLPNLQKHATGWPTGKQLRARTVSGNKYRGRKFIGAQHDTPGSQLLVERVDAGSAQRPLNIAIWGGQTDLAQALWRVKNDRGAPGLTDFVKKLRVYDIADQDRIADWIREQFPGMLYVLSKAPAGEDKRSSTFRGMYLTGDQSLTSREWIDANVRSRGPLGQLYPTKTWTAPNPHGCMKEGDTPSWFFFLALGGNDPRDPTQPGWGGQFERQADGWYTGVANTEGFDRRTTVSKHRAAFQADFAKRMSWCE
ncbi:MAG: DUF1593 domain-containing protein [Aureliella sp.]